MSNNRSFLINAYCFKIAFTVEVGLYFHFKALLCGELVLWDACKEGMLIKTFNAQCGTICTYSYQLWIFCSLKFALIPKSWSSGHVLKKLFFFLFPPLP